MEKLLVERMVKWIISRKMTGTPVTIDLGYFSPLWFSDNQSTQLIKKGFNPKMALYVQNEEERKGYTAVMTGKFGKLYKEAKENVWFCFDGSKCETICSVACPDKKRKFISSAGFRVEKNKKIGQGGFGSVYVGAIHGAEIAAKFIDITDKYHGVFGRQNYAPAKVIPAILGNVAYEATLQSGFGHKNILKSKEWWLQLSNGKLIELVISTRKCYCNLKEWLVKEPFNFEQIRQFLTDTTEALDYLAGQKLSHRDVKPSNILISNKNDPVAKLTDFGLMNSEGVTPVFCAPEQFVKDGTVVGKTDVHGMGVSILATLFLEDDAMKVLFAVSKATLQSVLDNTQADPVIALVTSMIQYDPADRPTLTEVKTELKKLPQMESRKTVSSLHLKLPTNSNLRANTLKLKFEGVPLVNITVTPSTQPHRSIISWSIHNQLESGLCWAFAFSSLIRGELKRLIRKLAATGLITTSKENETIRLTDKLNTENRLMNEIVCLVVPRNPKLVNVGKAEDQMIYGKSSMDKICFPSLMRPAGWKRLPSVRTITDKLTDSRTTGKH